mgnify:CR=1 FL=1
MALWYAPRAARGSLARSRILTRRVVSQFHPIAPAGFFPVGSVAVRGQVDHPQVRALVVREPAPTAGVPQLLAPPTGYTKVWEDKGTGGRYGDCSLWWPNAPAGYVAIGTVAVKGYNQPHLDLVRCIHLSAVVPAQPHPEGDGHFIWCDRVRARMSPPLTRSLLSRSRG